MSDAVHSEIKKMIASGGVAIIAAEPTPIFQYATVFTVGLTDKALPELVLVLPLFGKDHASALLKDAIHLTETWKRPLPPVFEISRETFLRSKPVKISAKSRVRVPTLSTYYGLKPYALTQVFAPDPEGKWPWDTKCHPAFKVPWLS